jgi:TolB-like protein
VGRLTPLAEKDFQMEEPLPRAVKEVRFGPFEFNLLSGELNRNKRNVGLIGQPIQILALLLERRGNLVTREELQQLLWPNDTFVDFEHGLNAAIRRLRFALEDSADNPQFIETLARRGYRFIAPIEVISTVADEAFTVPQQIRSIGVLPFETTEKNTEIELLADGITERLINSLAQMPGVRVMARSTVYQYKNRTADPQLVGRRLNVDAVILGRIRRIRDDLMISIEMVEVSNGWQLWGEQYTRNSSDLVEVQRQVFAEIVANLRPLLSEDQK